MAKISGGKNAPHWNLDNILDFQRAMSVKIMTEMERSATGGR